MNDHRPLTELEELTVTERLRLMEEIWNSLTSAPKQLDVPAWHRNELDRRLAEKDLGAHGARLWTEVRAEILAGLLKS